MKNTHLCSIIEISLFILVMSSLSFALDNPADTERTSELSTTQSQDLSNEPNCNTVEKCFERSRWLHLQKDKAQSAKALRRATEIIGEEFATDRPQAITEQIKSLNKLAEQIERGQTYTVKFLVPHFSKASIALAEAYLARAQDINESTVKGEALENSITNLLSSNEWRGETFSNASAQKITLAHELAKKLKAGNATVGSEEAKQINALNQVISELKTPGQS